MDKELNADEVYMLDTGHGDVDVWRYAEGSPFGPFATIEVNAEDGEQASLDVHSPDTAARLALALLVRVIDGELEPVEPAYTTAMRALEHRIKEAEAGRDFKIKERVEVFDPSKGDLGWLSATVLEYSRHGGYLIRNYWNHTDFYSPAHIRKVGQDD